MNQNLSMVSRLQIFIIAKDDIIKIVKLSLSNRLDKLIKFDSYYIV